MHSTCRNSETCKLLAITPYDTKLTVSTFTSNTGYSEVMKINISSSTIYFKVSPCFHSYPCRYLFQNKLVNLTGYFFGSTALDQL